MILFFLGFCLAGCVSAKNAIKTEHFSLGRQVEAEKLIQELWQAFVHFRRENFSAMVSDDFTPTKADFVQDVANAFYKAQPLLLDFTINKISIDDNKLSVTFSWKRKVAIRKDNALSLSKGEGGLIFIRKNNTWLLYKIEGASIFTV